MDVTLESSAIIPSPLKQTYPTSPPSGSRKRPFCEVDDNLTTVKNTDNSSHEEGQEKKPPLQCATLLMDAPVEGATVVTPAPAATPAVEGVGMPVRGDTRTVLVSSTHNPNFTVESLTTQSTDAAGLPSANKKPKPSPIAEANRLEKEEKERLKLEEKAKKEEEKKKREAEREEERRKKEEKKRLKEEERIAKEEEKRKREEEKLKKEKVGDLDISTLAEYSLTSQISTVTNEIECFFCKTRNYVKTITSRFCLQPFG